MEIAVILAAGLTDWIDFGVIIAILREWKGTLRVVALLAERETSL
jgi:hypothetical protein